MKRRIDRNVALVSATLSIMGLISAPVISGQNTKAKLAGAVVSDAGHPVKYATVQIHAPESGGGSRSVMTDKEGRFSFVNLPPGTYQFHVHQAGYVQPHQTGEPPFKVTIGEGQEMTDLTVVLMRGGVMTGRVLDEDGDPIVNTQVVAWRKHESGSFQQTGYGQTDDRGVYRIHGLPPGEYVIGSQIPQHSVRSVSGGIIYYPGVPSQKAAELLSVSGGAETTDIDIRIEPNRGARLIGRVTLRASRKPLGEVGLSLYGENFSLSATTDGNGQYAFTNLPPGRFQLRIDPRTKNILSLQKEVRIESVKTTRLDLEVETGGQISGFLELVGERMIPDAKQVSISVQLTPLEKGQSLSYSSRSAQAEADGAFVINGLSSGRASFRIQAPNNRYFLKAVYQGESETPEGQLMVKAGQETPDVRLILSDEVGEVRGYAKQPEDRVIAYQIVLVPVDESPPRSSQNYRYGHSGGQQPAVIQGVPAGRYLLFALENNIGFGGETFIRNHRSRAIELDVRPYDVIQVEVEPITAEDLGIRR